MFLPSMKLEEIAEEAGKLPTKERAELAAFLLRGLEEVHHWVDDEEVLRRREELESGQVHGLSLSEFRKACGR